MDNITTISFNALGTMNQIDAYGCPESLLQAAADRVKEIHCRMSAFLPDSDIGLLNANAGIKPVRVHEDTIKLLQIALDVSRHSKGAFDVTLRPLIELWRIGEMTDLPSQAEITSALAPAAYRSLRVHRKKQTAYINKPSQGVDLGGIAKGYAADEAKNILISGGVRNALINFGGNVIAIGENEKEPWKIGLQDPLSVRGDSFASLTIRNSSVVTSGCNERFFIKDSVRYHHIIDPRTGYPARSGLLSVTVVCEKSVIADALSTAVFVLGIEIGMKLLRKYNAQAVFVLETGELYVTEKLKADYRQI